jgi:hypothetical protein
MRDFIIVAALSFATAFAIDAYWFKGKFFGALKKDVNVVTSSIRR